MTTADSNVGDLYERHRALVRKIASQTRSRYRLSIDLDELEAAGYQGLVEAGEAFDPNRGTAFSTFAYYRIRGAILDTCRSLGLIRRQYRKRAQFDEAANSVLAESASPSGQHGSWITQSLDNLAVAFELSEHGPLGESPERRTSQKQLGQRLRQAMTQLSEQERRILEQYYFEERRMREIAEELDVSVSWVSRVHRRLLGKLRPLLLGQGGSAES